MLVFLWAQGLRCPEGHPTYLIEVSHVFAVLQDPGVEGLPWVGKEEISESGLPGP